MQRLHGLYDFERTNIYMWVQTCEKCNAVAAVNGRQIEPILASLNMLVAQGNNSNGMVSPEQLKTPNIELHF